MIKQLTQLLVVIGLSLTIASCSGGGGNASTPVNPPPSNPGPVPTDILIELDKSQIKNSGGDFANLTVTTLDANRNIVAAAAVQVSLDQDAVFTTTTSTTTGNVTDANGKFTGKIGIGANKSDRLVTITVFSGSISKTAALRIAGSTLSANFVPSNPKPNDAVIGSVKLVDAIGAGIPGSTISLSGISGIPATVLTDAQGNASFQFTAPSVSGSYNLSLTGSGITPSPFFPLIVSSGPGTVPNAKVPAALVSASLTINPSVIAPNALGSTANGAQLKALFQSSANTGVQNMRVRFEIIGNKLGGGESISSDTSTVLSDNAGIAISNYYSGTRSSPTNGVQIKMCYSEADFLPAPNDCPYSQTNNLTVAAAPLSITIGDDNKLSRGAGDISYIKKFGLFVVDSAGAAVSNANVSISVDLIEYYKGSFSDPTTPKLEVRVQTCPNEDLNRNGVLDNGEDTNHNGQLEPRKSDIVVSYQDPLVKATNANGVLLIQVEYPQNVARWIKYALKVSVNAAGSEGTTQRIFTTNYIDGDQTNGSFLNSPYGIQPGCDNVN